MLQYLIFNIHTYNNDTLVVRYNKMLLIVYTHIYTETRVCVHVRDVCNVYTQNIYL